MEYLTQLLLETKDKELQAHEIARKIIERLCIDIREPKNFAKLLKKVIINLESYLPKAKEVCDVFQKEEQNESDS